MVEIRRNVEAEDLKKFRRDYGLTQKQFAELCGVSHSTYRFWEYGVPQSYENKKRLKETMERIKSAHS